MGKRDDEYTLEGQIELDDAFIKWSISDEMSASGTVIPAIRMAYRNRPFTEGILPFLSS